MDQPDQSRLNPVGAVPCGCPDHEACLKWFIHKFEKEHLGRGPLDARSYFLDDMILVRLSGIMTPAEAMLAQSHDGQDLVKETRRQLLEASRQIIEKIVRDVLDCAVISLHTDMSTKTGERVIVLRVDINLTDRFA